MGFYLLSDLHNLSSSQRSYFSQCLETIGRETKEIAGLLPFSSQELAQQTIPEISILLRRYSSMITANLLDRKGKPTPKVKRIEEVFFKTINAEKTNDTLTLFDREESSNTTVFSQTAVEHKDQLTNTIQLENEDISPLNQLSIAFIMLIEGYIASMENSLQRNVANLELNNSLIRQGIILLGTIHAWMIEEVELTPKFLKQKEKATEVETRRSGTANAREERQRMSNVNHTEIIQEYNRLVEENPGISKNKAAEMIHRKGIGNLSFIGVRRHLPTG